MEVPPTCTLPPEGWWCSREAGHDGPCAARVDGDRPVDKGARFILTSPITFPAGTVLHVSDRLGDGGLCAYHDGDLGLSTLFLGRARALREGLVVSKPELGVVPSD